MGRYQDFEKVTAEALTFACNSLGLECGDEQRSGLLSAYNRLTAHPEVAAALAELSRFPLAILSNGSPKMLASVLQNAGLRDYFSRVISANEVKCFKPSSATYELAVTQLAIANREEIGFVSSNAWDIAGAASFGFTTFWINRTPSVPFDELGYAPAAVIQGLDKLASLFPPA